MSDNQKNPQGIFFQAVEIESVEDQRAYLDQACQGDDDLRAKVDGLIRAYQAAGSFLEEPIAKINEKNPSEFWKAANATQDETTDSGNTEGKLADIGPYKLLQQIGEGGMGSVYMAQQEKPVKRRVALKVTKAGMDSKQVIARFEAERQALALMDHPNIARLLDVGTTDTGRPYFVMELVKGIPITQYCDQKRLNVTERLEMFTLVCNAVQHAHQKGIIHRDLKPNNILITEYDEKAVPKIIDFGLAKALDQNLTDKTMFTQFGQVMGTFTYMSPEQSKVNALDVDTRADIYSLGVLLYELLTGTTPFDANRLKSAALDQVLKIIREEEPPKPSTRMSDSEGMAASISEQRQIEPARLRQILRGELDWVIMKALDKDRARRYQHVSNLADDLSRYLNNETVNARPPSLAYRTVKFAKKNRSALVAVGSILIVSILVGSLWRYTILAERKQNERQMAIDNVETQVDILQTTRGIAVPFVLEKLDDLPRELVLAKLKGRFGKANGQQKLNLAYGLANLGHVEMETLLAAILNHNTESNEAANIIRAIQQENRKYANEQLRIAASNLTKKTNDWKSLARLAIVSMYLDDMSLAFKMLSAEPDKLKTLIPPENPFESLTLRTMFITEFGSWACDLKPSTKLSSSIVDPNVRSGICLAIGGINVDQPQESHWRTILENWYSNSPDSGTHSASGWALRQWGFELPDEPKFETEKDDCNWWHIRQGLRFVKIRAGKVVGRNGPIVVKDDYWLSDCEITVGLFEQFMADEEYHERCIELKPNWKGARVFVNDNSSNLPVQEVSWYDAVLFCNWLSWKLELEPCYEIEVRPLNEKNLDVGQQRGQEFEGDERREPFVITWQRGANGIRLPTKNEWEYACRASTTSMFSFGSGHYGFDQHPLGQYGWFRDNSNQRTHPVRSKRCNAWGMFDMHGNVTEFCWDYFQSERPWGSGRVVRGGDFDSGPSSCRSSSVLNDAEIAILPSEGSFNIGFRVSRGPSSPPSLHDM